MEIGTRVNNNGYDITVTGNIKTIVDGKSIKDAITLAAHHHVGMPINLYIKDSFIITSSVIGFLIKVSKVDKLPLQVIVSSNELYEMLSEMNLLDSINIKKA
ncbi:MAG: hypothetical protein PHR87_04930 [Sulfurospirillaceae bacterium]|nr:hypothetical protein [Sulfurospirillaceae bacterium]